MAALVVYASSRPYSSPTAARVATRRGTPPTTTSRSSPTPGCTAGSISAGRRPRTPATTTSPTSDGKYFVSFPPFPAVLLAPSVWLAGERREDARRALLSARSPASAPAFLFLALDKLARAGRVGTTEHAERSRSRSSSRFGTVYWFTAVQGTVWFAAHVVGAALARDSSLLLRSTPIAPRSPGSRSGSASRRARRSASRSRSSSSRGARRRATRRRRMPRGSCVRSLLRRARRARVLARAPLAQRRALRRSRSSSATAPRRSAGAARIDRWGLFSYHYLGRNLAVCLTELPFSGAPRTPRSRSTRTGSRSG